MIKSMTAFARGESQNGFMTVSVEIRSYNNRFLDCHVRLPQIYLEFEPRIKQVIGTRFTRGRIDVRISVKDEVKSIAGFEIDEKLADAYVDALSRIKKRYNLPGDIPIDLVAGATGIIIPREADSDLESAWAVIKNALDPALDELEQMRIQEGRNLANDITKRISHISGLIEKIEDIAQTLPALYKNRLEERISELTGGIIEIDPARIAQEAAILADKADISEEIVRAKSHTKQFVKIMNGNEPAGKPLNFLVQELGRELNTMGVKAGSAEVSHMIVTAKSELEKIREQIQNIE